MQKIIIPPFPLGQKSCTTMAELVDAMSLSWTAGKQLLFSGRIREHIRRTDSTIASMCSTAEKKYQSSPPNGDIIFLEWICKVPGTDCLYWQGRNYGSYPQVKSLVVKRIDQNFNQLLLLMLRERLLSVFLKKSNLSDTVIDNIKYVEHCYNKSGTTFNKMNAPLIVKGILEREKTFVLNGTLLKNEFDLARYLQKHADISRYSLSSEIQPLFQNDQNLAPAFEAWLINLGKHKELSAWRDKYQIGQTDDDIDYGFIQEDEEEQKAAQTQKNTEFANASFGFENDFQKMLDDYPDAVKDIKVLTGLMKDLFPQKQLQVHLLLNVYKMDFLRAIGEAKELNDLFTMRYVRRLVQDYGVKEDFAKWAVSVWCVCYGEQILHKKNTIAIYKVI